MTPSEAIQEIARHGLNNDQEELIGVLNSYIAEVKEKGRYNFAVALQSLVSNRKKASSSPLALHGSEAHLDRVRRNEADELILERLKSNYRFENLVSEKSVSDQLHLFIEEHKKIELLRKYGLPVANKLMLYGPSGCGKTLTSYVIAGELEKEMIVLNLGSIVSSKLGETSKNLAKVFRQAAADSSIIFIDEFDSLGKLRDYSQDHAEMKRVVNTILQLFDYLPQNSLVIAATNQKNMIDDALLRRFDLSVGFSLPGKSQIKELVELTMKKKFTFDNPAQLKKAIDEAEGLSYDSIQKSLITAIKKSLFRFSKSEKGRELYPKVAISEWISLLKQEKSALHQD